MSTSSSETESPNSWGPGPVLTPAAGAMNVIGLMFLVFGVSSFHRVGLHGAGPVAALVLLIVATAGWLAWAAARTWSLPAPVFPVSLFAFGLAGAALTGFVALAMVYPAVAALGVTLALPGRRAATFMVLAIATLFVATAAANTGIGAGIGASAAVLSGAIMGLSRRATHERERERANVRIAEAQAEAERARAELLAGRNHLARELHDVLAHTLSALSLQLQALDALMPGGPPSAQVAAQLEEIKRLVRDGLDEARGAVAALREDLPPLEERLEKLAAERGTSVALTGSPRALPAEVSLALYRVAQEGLTNVMKHAPGAIPEVALDYSDKEVTLSVTNPLPPTNPAAPNRTGGGYGLQGIRERVLLIGGRVEAGPFDGGWRVEARVPVAA